MSAEMPKIPEPVGEAFYDHVHKNGLIERRKTHIYTADQMREFAQEAARQAMEDQLTKMKAHIEADRDAHEMFRNHAEVFVLDRLIDMIGDELRALLPQSEKRHG